MALITIEEGGFKIVQSSSDSVDFWDLFQMVKVKHKDESESLEWKNIAWGISLANCLHTIIGVRVRMKHIDEIKHLKDFLDAYKKEKIEVFKYFKLDMPKINIDEYKRAEPTS